MTAPARASARRAAAAPQEKSRPPLWLIPRPPPGRPLAPFVVLMLVLLGAGLVGLLLLNTWSSQDAFRLHTLNTRQSTLDDQEQALLQQVQTNTDPLTLAARAHAQGLVPASSLAFVKEVGGRYVQVGTKHVVRGVRDGGLLVVPAPTTAAPPAATAPAVTASAPAASTASTAPSAAAATAPVMTPSGARP